MMPAIPIFIFIALLSPAVSSQVTLPPTVAIAWPRRDVTSDCLALAKACTVASMTYASCSSRASAANYRLESCLCEEDAYSAMYECIVDRPTKCRDDKSAAPTTTTGRPPRLPFTCPASSVGSKVNIDTDRD